MPLGVPTVPYILPDTGTSFCSLPPNTLNALAKTVEDNWISGKFTGGIKTAPCTYEEYLSLPDFTFRVDSTEYTISRHQWMSFSGNACRINMMSGGAEAQNIYLGINFFENFYGVFDRENNRVGFAESVYSSLSPEQSQAHNHQALMNLSTV